MAKLGSHRRAKEKAVKVALIKRLRESGINPREVAEWLWEDYGVRVRPDWRDVERAILREEDVTPQDLAVFMLDSGVEPDEGAWDTGPRPALRGAKGAGESR
ncbi:TPA: hypothetical protein EYP38_03140 [Candidatus Micrarchaeota archaeon]|nr:hypothetical protein [Candidatus Micrarchaeota archaeon]